MLYPHSRSVGKFQHEGKKKETSKTIKLNRPEWSRGYRRQRQSWRTNCSGRLMAMSEDQMTAVFTETQIPNLTEKKKKNTSDKALAAAGTTLCSLCCFAYRSKNSVFCWELQKGHRFPPTVKSIFFYSFSFGFSLL